MNKNKIAMLSTSILHPHPDNPRKDLGDLTELSESIAQSGVMQNLTVVPHKEIEGEYTVVIGHRRLGASKLAGLDVVPCVIVEMSDKDQLATMMLENMQRSDLTIIEQADGFQLMMDFGETVDSIAEKTGISKTTVRNRLKLTRYDKELLKKTSAYQPTMEQYLKLSEIEDVGVANDCLRSIGTKNFDNAVANAIRVQKEKKEREQIRAVLNTYAEKLLDASYNAIQERKLVSVRSIYPPYTESLGKELEASRGKYGKIYWAEGYGFTTYRDHTAEDDALVDASREKARKREDLQHRADAIYDGIVERAEEFVNSYVGKKSDFEIILGEFFISSMFGKLDYQGSSTLSIAEKLGYVVPEGAASWDEKIHDAARQYIWDKFDKMPCKTALTYLFECYRRKKPHHLPYREPKLSCSSWNFGGFLGVISELGYNVSDDEWAFLGGNHDIYKEEVPI